MTQLVQIILTLSVVAVVVWWWPILYVGMAILVCLIALAVFSQRDRTIKKVMREAGIKPDAPKGQLIDIGWAFIVALGLGAFWPTLPFILWREPRALGVGRRETLGPSETSSAERQKSEEESAS